MEVFIWERVGKVTDSYHCGGGLVIVDESLESAAASWLKYCEANNLKSDHDESTGLGPPDATYETPNAEQRIFVFPDAGCC